MKLVPQPQTTETPAPAQDQGTTAPAGTAGVAPTPESTTTEAAQTVTMTQDELNDKFGATRNEGRLALAKAYGYETIDAFDADFKQMKALKDSQLSEADKAKKEAAELKKSTQDLAKENRELKVSTASRDVALDLDVDPKNMADVLTLAKVTETKLDADGNPDRAAIKAAIKDVLTRNPSFKRGVGASVGGGGTPAGAAATALNLDQQIALANKEGRFIDAINLQTRKLFTN